MLSGRSSRASTNSSTTGSLKELSLPTAANDYLSGKHQVPPSATRKGSEAKTQAGAKLAAEAAAAKAKAAAEAKAQAAAAKGAAAREVAAKKQQGEEAKEEAVRAAESGDASRLAELLKSSDNSKLVVEQRDKYWQTPLRAAAWMGHETCLKMLIEANAELEGKNKDGHTALRGAAFKGQASCVRLLLKAGANKEAKDKDGRTALSIAAWKGHAECVEILLGSGADWRASTKSGASVMDLARQGGRIPVIKRLEAVEARASPKSPLHAAMFKAADELSGKLSTLRAAKGESKFETRELIFGLPKQAARGVEYYMCVDRKTVFAGLIEGLESMKAEIMQNGTNVDRECLDYVLHMEAGSSDVAFQGGLKRDCDEQGHVFSSRLVQGRGMKLEDFAAHPSAVAAGLTIDDVAALRFYTTAGYQSINNPLRDQKRFEREEMHPLPITVTLIRTAIGKLRVIEADGDQSNTTVDLYRGMRNVDVQGQFMEGLRGGTELAPMSTTSSLKIAMQYAASEHSVLMRLRTKNFMVRAPDISFLSAFPAEKEFLYPPLTYLQPTGDVEKLRVDDANFLVIDVEPSF